MCRLCDELHRPTSNTGHLLKNGARTASREEDSRNTSQNMTSVPAAKLSGAQQVLSQLAHAAAAVDTFPGLYTVFCK